MGNDMTWEQKCRISALRAACASQYNFAVNTGDILERAETFRIALLREGPLDALPEPAGDVTEQVSASPTTYVATCKHCMRAIQLIDPFNDETARWVDREGHSQCSGKQVQNHSPKLDGDRNPVKEVCPGCGSLSRSVAKVPPGGQLYCNHKWHQL